MIRKLKSRVRVSLGLGSVVVYGTITEIHEIPKNPDYAYYSVVWDDGEYAGELWGEEDFDQDFEDGDSEGPGSSTEDAPADGVSE